MKRAVN